MLYVGDTCSDIRVGKAAGTLTVAVLTGADDLPTLKAEEPDALLESIADLPKLLAQKRG
jgi:phosphoglycolate phosphatase-like HAD superfamily hydrolase